MGTIPAWVPLQGQSQPSYSTPADVSESSHILSPLLSFWKHCYEEHQRLWKLQQNKLGVTGELGNLFQKSMVKVALEGKLRFR